MQPNPFAGEGEISNKPPTAGFAITPSDGTPLANFTRWLYVGVSGDVMVDFVDGGTAIVLKAMPVGLYEIGVSKVYATSTTATNLVGMQ